MNYRIIALDVDGTLIDDHHELRPRVRAAVRAAAEQGAEIVLCTGRGTTSTLPMLEQLGLNGTVITHNGACVVDGRTREVLHQSVIPAQAVERYLAYCRERGYHFDMNTAFDLYVESLDETMAAVYKRIFVTPILRDALAEGLPEGTLKISIFALKEQLDELEKDWAEWTHDLQTVRSGDFFMDVQPLTASKGIALERLAKLRGVPREQILAIGNYFNDIGMLTFAGHGVAVANSPDAVKEAADEVTVSNNEDGVAVVLERLLG
ncbi:Cof-type HAD-IIB family hydrolase [Cohnella sp. AR92]|uniref:Cof-type HAD-IIB family hydrolase n=1 Tax=Cohnella sp. AR92 TaxID=648716 RepID=UPI000F8F6F0E|nr:Cof-type HAD-IIB family hydrolase [Cohnella sp. AR92]RUS47754.1 HAD family phosphatase [Cohnella sp. AR92]